jgi:hypothetical protein
LTSAYAGGCTCAPVEPVTFTALPRIVQVQLAVLGPLLFGMVCGFLLGESELGYWLAQVFGISAAFGSGFDHVGARSGAARGALAGVIFGLGLLAAHAIADTPPLPTVPSPLAAILIFTTVSAALFGAAGGWLRGRVAA